MSFAAIAIAGGAVTLAGTGAQLYGSYQANKDKKQAADKYSQQQREVAEDQYSKQNKLLDGNYKDQLGYLKGLTDDFYNDKAKLEDWKNKNSGSYMDTAEARAVLTQLFNQGQEANKNISSNSAITGASNAKELAQRSNTQRNLASVMGNMAGKGTQWRNMLDNQYMNRDAQLSGQKRALTGQKMSVNDQYNSRRMNLNDVYANRMMGNYGFDYNQAAQNADYKVQQWNNFGSNLSNVGSSLMTTGIMNGGFGGGNPAAGANNNAMSNNNWMNKNQNSIQAGDMYFG